MNSLLTQKKWKLSATFCSILSGALREKKKAYFKLQFPPSSKLTLSLFQFDRIQDLPENHYRVSGASWVNISNYYY